MNMFKRIMIVGLYFLMTFTIAFIGGVGFLSIVVWGVDYTSSEPKSILSLLILSSTLIVALAVLAGSVYSYVLMSNWFSKRVRHLFQVSETSVSESR
jgi:hypothetical protein